jgi:hypothetical protein
MSGYDAPRMSDDQQPSAEGSLPRWAFAAGAAILLLAPLVVFPWRFIAAGLLDGGDDALANLPQLIYSARMLLQGEMFWTPDLWMGHPMLGEAEFATLYLPRFLLLLAPPTVAYPVYVLGHYVLAELTSYAYLRHLSLRRDAALFGALAYAFTGFMMGHRGHTMYVCAGAWAPLVLLWLDRAALRRDGKSHLIAAVVFAMVPFSGAVQLTVYLAGTLLALASCRCWFERRSAPLVATLIVLTPGLLIAAAQLLPSAELSSQLATELRENERLAFEPSFHPALLPSLFLPLPVSSAELYSRAGVIVLCAAVLALASWRAAPAVVRAWAVVAAGSLLLMFGKHVPFLVRALHELPVIGILRVPARHNFELGLALSVLGAWGFQRARQLGAGSVRSWLRAAAVVAVVSWFLVWIGGRDDISGSEGAALLRGASRSTALVAALSFALWIYAITRQGLRRQVAFSALLLAPLAEVAFAVRSQPPPVRNANGLIEAAARRLPRARPVRLLAMPFQHSSIETLGGNSVLFHRDVQSLQGYSSIAYDTARELLGLDMFGQLRSVFDVSWSPLPSIFGVTNLVLPKAVCDTPRLALTGGKICGTRVERHRQGRGDAVCTVHFWNAPRYELYAEARAPSSDTPGVSILLKSPRAKAELFVPGEQLTGSFKPHRAPAFLAALGKMTDFAAQNEGSVPVELRKPGLYERRPTVIADVAAPGEEHAANAAADSEGVTLRPEGSTAVLSRHFARSWRGDDELLLVLEARTAGDKPEDLVFDVYEEHGYDPEDAQIAITSERLSEEWSTFTRNLTLPGAPKQLTLRLFSTGSGAVQVKRAALIGYTAEVAAPFRASASAASGDLIASAEGLVLEGRRQAVELLHLPFRPVEVRLDAKVEKPLTRDVLFGIARSMEWLNSGNARRTSPETLDKPGVVTTIVPLPASGTQASLFVRLEGDGELSFTLEGRDACVERGYRNPRYLANGLYLYENPRALPRAYTVGKTRRSESVQATRRALRALEAHELGRIALVEDDVPAQLFPGKVEAASFAARSAEIEVSSPDGPTLLVVNDRHDPDWAARIDGSAAPLLRVNGMVRGVIVPRGHHHVELRYRIPAAVWLGFAAAGIGIVLALFVAPVLQRSKFVSR